MRSLLGVEALMKKRLRLSDFCYLIVVFFVLLLCKYYYLWEIKLGKEL